MNEAEVSALTDEQIIQIFCSGDDSVYSILIERHYIRAYQVAYGILRTKEDAEEVVQDTFIKIYKVLDKFRGDAKFSTWLHRIVVNFAKNKYRWNKRRGSHVNTSIDAKSDSDSSVSVIKELASGESSPDESSLFSELEKGVWQQLENLAPVYREVLVMRNLEYRSYQEIAEILDIKIGTVKSRIARGREELKSCLKKAKYL